MAFPNTVLGIKVELAVSNVWTNITQYVYKESVKISRGSADEATRTAPSSARFLLNNRDGRFSPRNPNSPYYGGFNRNSDLLISVSDGPSYLDVAGGEYKCATPDSAQNSITGDIDVRFEATFDDWTGHQNSTGVYELAAKYTQTGNQRSWLFSVFNGNLRWTWSADGTATTTVVSTDEIIPPPSRRLAVRVTHDVNDGAGNNVVRFYTAPTIEGPWTQLGDPVTSSGTTSIFNSTAEVAVGDAADDLGFGTPDGKIHGFRLYNGISGTLAAGFDAADYADETTVFTGQATESWTCTDGAKINTQWNRFRGQVVAFPNRWETGGRDDWVVIEAKSLLRRHNQGTRPLQSALRRAIPSDPQLIAYWSLEDGENATRFGAATDNTRAMTYTGDVSPAAHAGPEGSDSLPSFSAGSSWFAPVPAPSVQGLTAAGEYQVEWLVNLQQVTTTLRTIMYIQTTGGIISWRFLVNQDTVGVRGYMRDGTVLVNQDIAVTVSPDMLNTWWRWQFRVVPNGGGLDWTITFWQVGQSGGTFTQTGVAAGVGRVSAISGVDSLSSDIEGISWGHLAVFNDGSTDVYNLADDGFSTESAWDRFDRLASEEGERVVLVGASTLTYGMGAQRPDRFIDLLAECADTDRGIFTDTRDNAGYSAPMLITRQSIYNQTPSLILDYTGSDGLVVPLDPSDDDLYLHNAVTAERERGSSSYVEDLDGPLGVNEVGEYEHTVTINSDDDEILPHHAGWELHVGTWDEERYPQVNVKLQAAPDKIGEALTVDIGSKIRIINARNESTRTWIPPGDIDLLVFGYTETLSQYQWEIEFNCVPARPFDVPVIDDLRWAHVSRIDTDGSELSEALDTTETAVEVFTTSGPTWTDEVENMPFDWTVGGEQMTVLVPGNLVVSNPLFDENITGWSASGCTAAFSTEFVHPDRRAKGSMKITPDGVGTTDSVTSTSTGTGTVNPGSTIRASMWVYSPNGHADIRPCLEWRDSSDVLISQPTGSAFTAVAGEWTYMEQDFTGAPSNVSQVRMRIRQGSTPAATDIYYVWAAQVCRIKASLVYDEFGRTDTDTWTKADSNQTWTNTGGAAADYDVPTGYGRHINPAVSTGHHSVIANTEADGEVLVDLTSAATPTGGSLLGGALQRFTDANNLYEARVEMTTANVLTLSIRKRVASVETQLGTFTHWRAHAALTYVRVRFQVIGTALKAKMWRVGDPEPDVWQVEVTDSDLSAAGSVGVKSVRAAANTNANAEFRFDNFELLNPQVYSVLRSENGIVKSHSSGADVELTYPMILAL